MEVSWDEFRCKYLMREILEGLVPVTWMRGFHDLVICERKFVEGRWRGGK